MASDIDFVVGQIIADLDLNERVRLANLPESEVEIVEKVLVGYLTERLENANIPDIDEHASDEAKDIVKLAWERLRETHRLRVVE